MGELMMNSSVFASNVAVVSSSADFSQLEASQIRHWTHSGRYFRDPIYYEEACEQGEGSCREVCMLTNSVCK